ncbi:MAG: hypothetical protein Q8M39_00995 [Sulfuricurvum sp.]|nr:hypothetical protein [Sulfuricurvum sp.]
MKVLLTLLSASAILSTFAFAQPVQATQQTMDQERTEVQNRFRTMNTNELLEKRGTMTQQRDRDQLHQELQNRYKTMTQDQKRKFDQRPPENQIRKGMGQGGGNMGGGMGGGKGGR